jgi:DnaK suppressor protein
VAKAILKKSGGKKAKPKVSSHGAGKKKSVVLVRAKTSDGKIAKAQASAKAAVAAKPIVKSMAGKILIRQSATAAARPAVLVKSNSKPKKKVKEREVVEMVNVPAPVPTDSKPAKNRAGLKSHELEHYRDLLLAKRRELVGDMSSMEREALQRGGSSNLSNLPMHMADMGTDNYEQEFTLGLMEKDRNLLREINSALAKIQDGSFGICEGTGNPINKARLEAQPWARFSIEYARKMEQRGVR